MHVDDARAPPDAASDSRPHVDDVPPDAGAPPRADPVDYHADSPADLGGTFDANASPHVGPESNSASNSEK